MAGSNASAEQLKKAFKAIDTDNSGYIDRREVRNLLIRMKCPPEKLEKLVQNIMDDDPDGDGKITFTEFMSIMGK